MTDAPVPVSADAADGRTKPAVTVPDGDRPADLEVTDLILGGGTQARRGDTVTTHYVGVAWSTGRQFDASWDRNDPLAFTVGVGQVIPGWDEGLLGMRVGGRRHLVIPPHLAYGSRGAGGVIAGGETLIFVVDLLDVR